MLSIQNEIIKNQLEKVSSIVDSYVNGNLNYPILVINWLKECEDELSKTRLPQGARLATLRARVANAIDNSQNSTKSRKEATNEKKYQTTIALQEAEELLNSIFEQNTNQLNTFNSKLQEILTAAHLLNIIPSKEDMRANRENMLKVLWQNLMEHQNTKPASSYLANSLTAIDRLYLLDNAIRNLYADMESINYVSN